MADFFRSQEFRVCVNVFVVLSMVYMVEADPVLKIANVGDDITLSCYRDGGNNDNYKRWYQNDTLIADWRGVYIDDPRYTQRHSYDGVYIDSNYITVSNIRANDSAIFMCSDYHYEEIRSIDVRVIGCSNCILTFHKDPNKTKVICSLDNYWAENTDSRVKLYYANRLTHTNRDTVITKNMFSFQVYKTEWEMIHSNFYLDINNNQEKRITCTLPPPPTTPSYTLTTQQTTKNTPLILTSTSGVQAESVTSPSVSTKDNTPKNTDSSSDEITNDANMTIIIVVLGSIFILVLVSIIVALRCRQTRNRQKNSKHNEKNSIKKDHPGDYYESVEEGHSKGPEYATSIKELKDISKGKRGVDHLEHGEMVENILYNSREQITDSSIPRMEGPLDNALYALPDKRATIGRETKTIDRETTSKGPDRSSDSNLLYGNSDIITEHQPKKDTLQHQTDQYENVDLPGSGGTEEIPLYEMPDKGPIGNVSKDTPKARQTSTLSRDDDVSVDALYAEVDKSNKK